MIRRVDIINQWSQVTTLFVGADGMKLFPDPSGGRESNYLILQSITGLDMPDSDIMTTVSANLDGVSLVSTRIQERSITILLLLNRDAGQPIAELRRELYQLTVGTLVRVVVYSDERTVYFDGIVETNHIPVFEKDITATITIIATSPYLYFINDSIVLFGLIIPSFQFPFENVYPGSNLVFSIQDGGEQQVTFMSESNVKTGCLLRLVFTGPATGVKLYDLLSDWFLTLDDGEIYRITGSGIFTHDIIEITSIRGQKTALLKRGQQTYNILNALGLDPKWLEIKVGRNNLRYTATTGLINVKFSIIYTTAVLGV